MPSVYSGAPCVYLVSVSDEIPSYLRPYFDASKRFGGGFGSLLWSDEQTQHLRFEALTRLCSFAGRSVLDAGCGRADLLAWLIDHQQRPHDYFGLEALDVLARAAEERALPDCTIIRGDFVQNPSKLFVGAEIIVFCGSLNTLSVENFHQSISRAFDATAEMLVFNFLCSPERSAGPHLKWYSIDEIRRLAGRLTDQVQWLDDYLAGDCTMLLRKEP